MSRTERREIRKGMSGSRLSKSNKFKLIRDCIHDDFLLEWLLLRGQWIQQNPNIISLTFAIKIQFEPIEIVGMIAYSLTDMSIGNFFL